MKKDKLKYDTKINIQNMGMVTSYNPVPTDIPPVIDGCISALGGGRGVVVVF